MIKIKRPQKIVGPKYSSAQIYVGPKYSSAQIFVGPKYSSAKIFVTSWKFRQLGPTKFGPIRYIVKYVD